MTKKITETYNLSVKNLEDLLKEQIRNGNPFKNYSDIRVEFNYAVPQSNHPMLDSDRHREIVSVDIICEVEEQIPSKETVSLGENVIHPLSNYEIDPRFGR